MAKGSEVDTEQVNILWDYFTCFFGAMESLNVFDLKGGVYVHDVVHARNRAIVAQEKNGTIIRGNLFILNLEEGVPKKRFLEREARHKPLKLYEEQTYPTKRILGSLPQHVVLKLGGPTNLLLLLQGKTPGSQRSERSKKVQWFENRIEVDHFKSVMPNLSPIVTSHSYLFAVNNLGSEPYITMEGQVIQRP